MKLNEITPGLSLTGVEPTQIVSVVATVPLGDGALQLIYRMPDGGMKERLLGRADETSISVATVARPFSFDGDGAAFQLACEAKRIDLAVADAMNQDALIVWEMNGAPLPAKNGGPVRLLVPGWYGVCNAKWLNHIQVQDRRFMGRFVARDYVTLIERKDGDQTIWEETSVSRIQLKSMVARLARDGEKFMASGFVLNDGTPLRSVEVRLDSGPWQAATMDRQNTKYSWKLFTYEFPTPGLGDHTIVSRATDVNGSMQPEEADLQTKKSRWENNGQFVRRFRV